MKMTDAERADLLEAMTDRLADRPARLWEAYGRLRAVLVEAEQIAGGYLMSRRTLSAAESRLMELALVLQEALRDFPERPDDADNALLGTAPESGSTAAPRKARNSAPNGRRRKPRAA